MLLHKYEGSVVKAVSHGEWQRSGRVFFGYLVLKAPFFSSFSFIYLFSLTSVEKIDLTIAGILDFCPKL